MLHDLRYSVRSLAKNPGFAGIVVIVLALGIGANTAIFTAANDSLFRPLPFTDSGQLVVVTEIDRAKEISGWTSVPDYLDWKQQNHVFADMAAWSAGGYNLTGGEPERVAGMEVTASFFPVLGVRPLLGRNFLPHEDLPKAAPAVILSHSLWVRRFSGHPEILGRQIVMDGRPATVIGVLPPGFWFSNAHEDVYVPLGLDTAATYRGSRYLKVLARLKPGIPVERAQAEMSHLVAAIAAANPVNASQGVQVERIRDRMVRDVKPALLALLAAVLLVLLIACANVANMLLARSAAREKEIAIRQALGACRWRIVRQMLVEGLLLSGLGGTFGILLAVWGVPVLYRSLPDVLQPLRPAGVDGTVLAFAAGLAMLASILFSLAPVWSVLRPDLVQSLKEGGQVQGGASRRRMRGRLVVLEVALSVVLLAGAGVLIKSFVQLASIDPGFRTESVLTVRIQRQRDQKEFCLEVLQRASSLPGVVASGAASNLPMTGQDWSQNLTVTDRPFRGQQDYIWACHRVATLDYFRAIGMRLRKGRLFEPADASHGERVAVINEMFAKKAWPHDNPVGKRFRIGSFPEHAGRPIEVIGVVADAKYVGLTDDAFPEMFFFVNQEDATDGMTLVFRTAKDASALAGTVRSIMRSIDRDQPITKIATLETLVAESVAPQRLTMLLGAVFAVLALALTATGLYGVIAYSVAQRTHEIAIRLALGAPVSEVVRLVVAQGLGLTVAGLALGLVTALAFQKLLAGLLFQVSPHDPLILAGVCAVLAGVALAASYLPARRAVHTDPVEVLRTQ